MAFGSAERSVHGSARVTWALVAAWALLRLVQVWVVGWGTGGDVDRYHLLGRLWGAGVTPYSGFLLEYPPGSLPVFLAPLLFGGEANYTRWFGLEMMAFDLATLWLVMAWAHRLAPEAENARVAAGASYLLFTAALFPVLYARFDLAPAMLTLLALYLAYGTAPSLGALALGFAGAVKVWPLALLPLWLILSHRRQGWPGAARAGGFIAVGFGAPVLPLLARAGSRVVDFLTFHYQRGIQLESTWATLAMILADLGVSPVKVDLRFGAIHFQGPAASLFAQFSTPAVLALTLAPQLVARRKGLGGPPDARGAIGLLATGGAVLGFLAGGKVLSPQFLVWIMPFLALVVSSPAGRGAALLASVLTTVIYPYFWPALLHQEPGHLAALAALSARNLVLACFYVMLLRRLALAPEEAVPGGGRAMSP